MPTVPRRCQAHRRRQQFQARRLRAAELFAAGVHESAWDPGGSVPWK
jgi:hypothetical protein